MKNIILNAVKLGCPLLICVVLVLTAESSWAAKPNCETNPSHPKCGGDDGGGDPPSGGNAEPQIVYRDGGMYLANADGSNRVQISPNNNIGALDAPGQRILFAGEGLDLLTYENNAGVIGNVSVTTLVTESDIGGSFQCCNIDWSETGDKYMYSYWENTNDGAIYRIMVAPNGVNSAFAQHVIVWEGLPNGGLGSPTWDSSGDYIYFFEEFNMGTPQYLLVLDVGSATPTTAANVVATADLTPLVSATGFDPGSNPQGLSAGYLTGGADRYSFDPGTHDARPDTSLCLMIPMVDWSASRGGSRFVMIVDLPAVFDPDSDASCMKATSGFPILNFAGTDFTPGDEEIIGQDTSKNRVRGIWIYDLGDSTRRIIIDNGGRPDWSN